MMVTFESFLITSYRPRTSSQSGNFLFLNLVENLSFKVLNFFSLKTSQLNGPEICIETISPIFDRPLLEYRKSV